MFVADQDAVQHPFWVATGAALVGTLLGGMAVYMGLTDRLTPPAPTLAAGVGPGARSLEDDLDPDFDFDSPTRPVGAHANAEDPLTSSMGSDRLTLVEAVRATRDTVVNIKLDETFRGAGVVYDPSGLVLTNFHVVEPVMQGDIAVERQSAAKRLVARFADGRERKAEIVVADSSEDVAVLKLVADTSAEVFDAAQMGYSGDLEVGEDVFAVGCPVGYDHTVARGIVSAVEREGVLPMPALQLDAAINFGNSGGPLFDLEGKLVGITTARASRAEGIGFAIPIDRIRSLLAAMKEGQSSRSGVIGVNLDAGQDPGTAIKSLGYRTGLHVETVVEGDPADVAGMVGGDVIVEIRGRRFDDTANTSRGRLALMETFGQAVRSLHPGEKLDLTIVRKGEIVPLTVEAKAATLDRQARIDTQELLGFRLVEGQEQPVVVGVRPDTVLAQARNRRVLEQIVGSQVTQIFGREVGSVTELGEALADIKAGARRGSKRTISISFRKPETDSAETGPAAVEYRVDNLPIYE